MPDPRPHVGVWFEIPASDLDRAARFYETVFGITMPREAMGPAKMAMFPYEKGMISGCVMTAPMVRPGADGAVIYLNADGHYEDVLARVPAAGGAVLMPTVTLPDDMGRFTHIRDTEGNRVGIHAVV